MIKEIKTFKEMKKRYLFTINRDFDNLSKTCKHKDGNICKHIETRQNAVVLGTQQLCTLDVCPL